MRTCPLGPRPRPRRPLHTVLPLLLAAVALLLDSLPAESGYSGGARNRVGQPLTAGADSSWVQSAIDDLCVQSVSMVAANRQVVGTACALLNDALRNRRLDRETNEEANRATWGATQGTGQGARINVDPSLFRNTGNWFQYLKSVLLHEAIHAMGVETERLPLQWEQFLLKNVKHLPQTDWFVTANENALAALNNPTPGGTRGGTRTESPKLYVTVNTLDSNVRAIDDVTSAEVFRFHSGFDVPTALLEVVTPGGAGLLVTGTDASESAGGMMLFLDTDADGWVEPATMLPLFAPGSFAAPVSLVRDFASGEFYLLDSILDRILLLRDDDRDGIPDPVPPRLWAAADAFPPLADALCLAPVDAGAVRVLPRRHLVESEMPHDTLHTLIDTDTDGLADMLVTELVCETLFDVAPSVRGAPRAGDATLRLFGQRNAPVNVWTFVGGVPVDLLGSGTVASCSLHVDVALSRPLVAGETLMLEIPGSAEPVAIFPVLAPGHEVWDAAPRLVTAGTALTLDGRFFGSVAGTVTVGDMPASISSWTPARVVVTVPPKNPLLATDLAMAAVTPADADTPAMIAVEYASPGTDVPLPGEAHERGSALLRFENPRGGVPLEILYRVPQDAVIDLSVYDVHGRLLRRLAQGRRAPGEYRAVWDGRDEHGRTVSGGVYFTRFEYQTGAETRKTVLIR